jgi:hypothetical protein
MGYDIIKSQKKERKRTMGNIRNLPNWHNEVKYIVARKCNGSWWYYWGGNDFNEAQNAAWECDGEVFSEWCEA